MVPEFPAANLPPIDFTLASPVPIVIDPESCRPAMPVLRDSAPLPPLMPDSAVLNFIEPLVVRDDFPDMRTTLPPGFAVMSVSPICPPATRLMSPPAPEFPSPTATTTAPPLPLVALPDEMLICPEGPSVAEPLARVIPPLTPASPASPVAMLTEPLEVF